MPRSTLRFLLVGLALEVLTLSGCFSPFIAPHSAGRPDQDVAIIINTKRWGAGWGAGCPFCVRSIRRVEDNSWVYEAHRDGQDVNPLRLMPGRYQIGLVWFNAHPMVMKGASLEGELDLQAGHTYTVRLQVQFFAKDKIWITDDTDGRVLLRNWSE